MYFVLADVATTTLAESSKRSAAGLRRDAKRQKKRNPGGSECSRLLGSTQTAGHCGQFVHAVSDQSSMPTARMEVHSFRLPRIQRVVCTLSDVRIFFPLFFLSKKRLMSARRGYLPREVLEHA